MMPSYICRMDFVKVTGPHPALAAGVAADILAVVAVVRFVRWLRRRGDHHGRP